MATFKDKNVKGAVNGNSLPAEKNSSGNNRQPEEKTLLKKTAPRRAEKAPFSNAEIIVNFELSTQEAIRLFQRHFYNASQSLFNIMINTTRLERLGEKGSSVAAKKWIDGALDLPTREIDNGIKAFKEMLEKTDGVSDISYTNPRVYETSIRTPEAKRLINLFVKYDEIITLLDKAYLNALAPVDEVDDTKIRMTINIQSLIKNIRSHAQSSVEQLSGITGDETEDKSEASQEQTPEDGDGSVSDAEPHSASNPVMDAEQA